MIHNRQVTGLMNALGGDPNSSQGLLLTTVQPTYTYDDLSYGPLGKRRGVRLLFDTTLAAGGAATFTAFEITFPVGSWLRRVNIGANGTFASQASGVSQVTTVTNFPVIAFIDLPEYLPPTSQISPTFCGTQGFAAPLTTSPSGFIQRLNTGSVVAAPANGVFLANGVELIRAGDPPMFIQPGQTLFVSSNTANATMTMFLDVEIMHIPGQTC